MADDAPWSAIMLAAVREAMAKVQSHWSPLHSVQLWDRLGLSRRAMDTLRHLLSYIYDVAADTYRAMVVWTSPLNEDDVLTSPQLASRPKREARTTLHHRAGRQPHQCLPLESCEGDR